MSITTHTVRVTVRIHIGSYRKELDLSLPAVAAVGELLDEVIDFAGAPKITRPWRISTVAGRRIDPTVPLEHTALADGSILIVSPEEHAAAPVIRGAAEALADDKLQAGARGIPVTWAVTGVVLFAACLNALVPLPVALCGAAAAALGIGVWCRRGTNPTALSVTALVTGTLAAATWVAGSTTAPLSLVLLAAAIAAGLVLFFGHLARLHGPRTTAAALTNVAMAGTGALGACFPGPGSHATAPATAAAGAVVAAAVIAVTIAPGLTARAAGLRVPQLPTAGEDLAVADGPPDDAGVQADRAQKLYAGLALGLALSVTPAALALALTGSGGSFSSLFGSHAEGAGFAQALLAVAAASFALHAARHRQPLAEWALTALTVSTASAVCVSAWARWAPWTDTGRSTHPWAMLAVAAVIALSILTAPLWAGAVPRLEPTTVRWVERAESLAIAACLPLAAHLVGLFVLIRGLG